MWENPRRGYDPVLVKALINLIGVYPVGTCVILDTFEVAIVSAAVSPTRQCSTGPLVRICIDDNGGADSARRDRRRISPSGRDGGFLRSIVKVTNPDRYGLVPGHYLV